MAPLISKPGLTSASVLAIPKNWSPEWMRGLISNQLTGADVRNAVGANGISISGNIASPYATIGFKGPMALPGPVTVNGSGNVDVIFNGAAQDAIIGSNGMQITATGTAITSFAATQGVEIVNVAGVGRILSFNRGSSTYGALLLDAADVQISASGSTPVSLVTRTWTALPLNTNVSNFSPGTWEVAQYTQTPEGRVILRGLIQGSGLTVGGTIATLPVGYRPTVNQMIGVVGDTGGTSKVAVSISVASTGVVSIDGCAAGNPTGWLTLNGIEFYTN